MKIAVCDDNIKDIKNITAILEEYKESHKGTEFEIVKFSNPDKLREASGLLCRIISYSQEKFHLAIFQPLLYIDIFNVEFGSAG